MFDLYVGRDRRRESFCGRLCFYDDLREKFKNVLMKEVIEFGEERKTEAGKKRLMQLLLGTGLQGANKEAAAKLRQETLNFCRGAMCRRRAVVLRLDQRI